MFLQENVNIYILLKSHKVRQYHTYDLIISVTLGIERGFLISCIYENYSWLGITVRHHLVTQTFQIDLKQPCYLMVSSYNERLIVATIDTHLIWYILWWNGFQKRWEILSPLGHIICTAFKTFKTGSFFWKH